MTEQKIVAVLNYLRAFKRRDPLQTLRSQALKPITGKKNMLRVSNFCFFCDICFPFAESRESKHSLLCFHFFKQRRTVILNLRIFSRFR